VDLGVFAAPLKFDVKKFVGVVGVYVLKLGVLTPPENPPLMPL